MSVQTFKLSPSKRYLLIIIIVYFSSCLVALLLPIPLIFKLVIVLALTSYLGWATWKYCLLQAATSILALRFISDKKWVLLTRTEELEAVLLGDSTITRWVAILRFSIDGQRTPVSCILFADALTADEYRSLVATART